MAGNNPRKFKDRIALLNQKQAESTEQFEVRSFVSFIWSWLLSWYIDDMDMDMIWCINIWTKFHLQSLSI